MPKVSGSLAPYVCARWSKWLHRALTDAGLTGGQLARAIRTSEEPDSEPRAAVIAWLAGDRAPTPASAFRVGQALAAASCPPGQPYKPRPGGGAGLPSFNERPPAPGGLMALHGAGYFGEAMAVVLALLRNGDDAARAYVARFVPVCWIAHADLDADAPPFDSGRRDFWRRYIGDAPVDALDVAWRQRHRSDALARALLMLGSNGVLRSAYERDPESIYHGAVVAWRALVESISIEGMKDKTFALPQWESVEKVSDDYWKGVKRRVRSSRDSS